MTSVGAAPTVTGDALRIKRVIGRWIGGGYVCYLLVSLPRMSLQASIVAGWWTPLAILLVFVPGWLLLVTSFMPAREWIGRTLPLACGVGYLIAISLWFVAWNGEPLVNATWMIAFPGLASLAMVIGPRPWLAGPHLVAATVLALATNWVTDSQPNETWVTLSGIAWSTAFSGVFVAAGLMAVRTGEVLDASRERAHRIAAESAAEQARDAERSRYDGLVHDGVLAVMLAVRSESTDARLALQAQRVMDEFDTPLDDLDRPVTVSELVAAVRAVVMGVDDEIIVCAHAGSAYPGGLDQATVQAFAGATAEAARNSTRHGGAEATIEVTVAVDCRGVCVTVSDTGTGFDPVAVTGDRLGVTVSIRERMAAVGGQASVISAPGGGTRVILKWPS